MIKCIAVDDSPLALDLLADYAKRTGILNLEYKCTSALEAARILAKNKYDLVFLDVNMPDFSGIDLAKSIGGSAKIIFTTAYPDFAVEGFNLDAVDYLLKPFSFARFSKAVSKAESLIASERAASIPVQREEGPFIYIRSGYETVKVHLRDIEYIEALKDYIQVFTAKEKILSLMSMKDILSLLPAGEFMRVHRSFIVPLSKVARFSARKLLVGAKEIPVGDVFRNAFMSEMSKRLQAMQK